MARSKSKSSQSICGHRLKRDCLGPVCSWSKTGCRKAWGVAPGVSASGTYSTTSKGRKRSKSKSKGRKGSKSQGRKRPASKSKSKSKGRKRPASKSGRKRSGRRYPLRTGSQSICGNRLKRDCLGPLCSWSKTGCRKAWSVAPGMTAENAPVVGGSRRK